MGTDKDRPQMASAKSVNFLREPPKQYAAVDRQTGPRSKKRFNIVRLCPNHHQLLDGGDPETTELSKQILLFREAKRIIETGPDGPGKQKELLRVSQAIITRRVG